MMLSDGLSIVVYSFENRCKYQLSWQHCTNLEQLREKLRQVLDSISPEAIASLCGWDYIIKALLSATL
jgi:putative transposase